MESFSFDTLRSIYITNEPYRYPLPWVKKGDSTNIGTGSFASCVNTGWHIIPNILWGHVASPKQWWEMIIKYEAIEVIGIKCRMFNPIPIQTAVSFQGTSTFPAFNNTVYALGYTDDLYETPWFDWWCSPYVNTTQQNCMYDEFNPAFKEGFIQKKRSAKFDDSTEASRTQNDFDSYVDTHTKPRFYYTKIYASAKSNLQQDNTYRRQFLPIYWYHFNYKQYGNVADVSATWKAQSSDFEYAYNDVSGLFWDPLNRPSELMELRPGKNMIEYSWNIHECDAGIIVNTDRLASLTPYGRPRPTTVSAGMWNMPMKPRPTDPRGPSNSFNSYAFLRKTGLINAGETETVSDVQMAPEGHMGLVDWRKWPVVPSRWFYKEIQESNPWVYNNIVTRMYSKPGMGTGCALMTDTSNTRAGDVENNQPLQDFKFVGTEFEQHKYPPTQWFLKAVPLFDDQENRIPVEMQMFMHITISLKGKPRRSAIYAPTWGPITPMNLYSVNMDTAFGESYMRVRSGGARRTWYDPTDTYPVIDSYPEPAWGDLYPQNSSGVSTEYVPHTIQRQCSAKTTVAHPAPVTPFTHTYSVSHQPPSLAVKVTPSGRIVTEKNE